jgi:hypothetical protein
MKRHLSLLLAVAVLGVTPLLAQPGAQHRNPPAAHPAPHNQPRANQGHPPPAPRARAPREAAPQPERFDGGRVNSVPHVNHDTWYGHDRPDDPRFRVAKPFAHGRFAHVGPSFRYRAERFDRNLHRFWIPGGFYFQIAAQDWALCADWCWDCNEDYFVIYDDPDHPGWYLVYNIHTGQYVHAEYYGS